MATSQIFKPTPVFTNPVIDSRNMVQVSIYAEFMMEGLEKPPVYGDMDFVD